MTLITTTEEDIRGNRPVSVLEDAQDAQPTHTPLHDLHKDTNSIRLGDSSEASNNEYDSDHQMISSSDDDDDDDDDDKLSDNWFQAKLTRLLNSAKGVASKPVVNFVEKYLKGTKLIFVVGQTGTGKSTILQELTGLDLSIGYTLNSGTQKYEICPALIDGQQYLFVDTAGFGAADMDDMANFYNIISCLKALGPFVTVAGLLFVYGRMQNRLRKEDLKTIQWVQCFCGPKFFRNIVFVTNQWDSWSPKTLRKTWNAVPELLNQEDISRILNPPGSYRGGTVYHHGFPGGKGSVDDFEHILDLEDDKSQRRDELRNLIKQRYANATGIKLQVAREIESGVPITETEAAKVLNADTFTAKIHIKSGRALITVKSDALQTSSPIREALPTPSTSQLQVQSQRSAGYELSTTDLCSTDQVAKPRKVQPFVPKPLTLTAPLLIKDTEDTEDTEDTVRIGSTEDTESSYPKSWWQTVLEWTKLALKIADFFKSSRNNRPKGQKEKSS